MARKFAIDLNVRTGHRWRRLAGPFARCHGTGVPERVRLYRDGSLAVPDSASGGCWSAQAWTTRWLSVVPVEVGGRRRRLVVAAWRNDPGDYRVLRTWLRHPPAPEDASSADPVPR